jgi:hypothetical protein
MVETDAYVVEKYRKFVRHMMSLTAGGPPVSELIDAIETDTVNNNALAYLLCGFQFESYTEEPKQIV